MAARSKLNYATFALMPDSHCRDLGTKLIQETDLIISSLTFQKNLIEWECLELIACDHVFEENIKDRNDFKGKFVIRLEFKNSMIYLFVDVFEEVYKKSYHIPMTLAQTPHVVQKPIAPEKVADPVESLDGGGPAPKRGRRVFCDSNSLVVMIGSDEVASGSNQKTPVDSDCDCEIPCTPSPVAKSSYRPYRSRPPRRVKAAPLVFDESEDNGDISKDVFESFDALRITVQVDEKKKTNNGKKTGKKKDTSNAKKKPAKTARL